MLKNECSSVGPKGIGCGRCLLKKKAKSIKYSNPCKWAENFQITQSQDYFRTPWPCSRRKGSSIPSRWTDNCNSSNETHTHTQYSYQHLLKVLTSCSKLRARYAPGLGTESSAKNHCGSGFGHLTTDFFIIFNVWTYQTPDRMRSLTSSCITSSCTFLI